MEQITITFLRYVVQANFPSLFIAVGMIVFILANKTLKIHQTNIFLSVMIINLLLILSDATDYWCELQPHTPFLRYVSSAVGYTLRPVIEFLLIIIIRKNNRLKISFTYFTVPLFINMLFSLISIKTHWVFYFDDINLFYRGKLGLLPFIVSFFYLFLLSYYAILNLTYNKQETFIIFLTTAFILVSVAMESFLHYRFSLPQAVSVTLLFYFLHMNVMMYKRDALTNLLNRRCFFIALEDHKKDSFILLSMDLNDLKKYNDTQGHAAGDEAIRSVTSNMKKAFSKYATIYRTGGDEFIAIFLNSSIKEVNEHVKTFQNLLSKTIFKVACGIDEYKPGDDIEQIISSADKKMYQHKLMMKKASDATADTSDKKSFLTSESSV